MAQTAPRILVLGDSLSAAYGLPLEQGWVNLLQARLRAEGYPHAVVNESVAGETTAGGLARLPASLQRNRPALVLIELGANDGLRGLSLAVLKSNLLQMVTLVREAGATPLVFEMRIPPNYGPLYTERFVALYGELAAAEGVPLVPFFLSAIALDPGAFQEDGIHPTAAAQPALLDAVWPHLRDLLDRPAAP